MSFFLRCISNFILLAASGSFLWVQNNFLTISYFKYKSKKLSSSFDNFSILQISDLHNKQFGNNQKRLVLKTKQINPNIIVITGDLIDKRRTKNSNIQNCLSYIRQAIDIAPIYFVPGNHEGESSIYKTLKDKLIKMGVHVLDNKSKSIKLGNKKINIIGINDISFYSDKQNEETINMIKTDIGQNLSSDKEVLNILLSHRPSLLESYSRENVDLVLSGHTHGGQIRLPIIGGIIDTNKNKTTSGMLSGKHKLRETTIIISRGLGNSLFPLRLFNYPELVVVKLKSL